MQRRLTVKVDIYSIEANEEVAKDILLHFGYIGEESADEGLARWDLGKPTSALFPRNWDS